MYISKLVIDGFRGFNHSEVEFQNGLNVIIGHNNGGKSTIMKALRLVLEHGSSKKLSTWDFCQNVDMDVLKENAPSVTISVYIKEQEGEGVSDDVALFTSYAVQTTPLLESCLTYAFFLPQTEVDNYKKDVEKIEDKYSLFKTIEDKYIRKYTHIIWGGPKSLQNQAQGDDLKKIDFEFVDALRNVEDDIYGGKATLLRDVLRYFLDYDVREDDNKDEKVAERHQNFIDDANDVIENVTERIKRGKDNILDYANRTGALFANSELSLDGDISESDLLMVLNLLVGNRGDQKLPVSLNGLGYNNLIYISLLLAKMQSNAKVDFMGSSNVKAFSVLGIEEPEAHLHPQMQYQFLEFLRNNIKDGYVKQVFVTSHSPSLVANVKLDELCCLHKNEAGEVKIYPPRKILDGDDSAKKFIQRYLDATRADMLFAGGIIFVEGMAEQVLLPVFAKLLSRYDEWLKKHIIVININGRYFDNFTKLYDSRNSEALGIKVACVTDRDPMRKNKVADDSKTEPCWPLEYGVNTETYDYWNHSGKYVEAYKEHPNIRFFSQSEKGKTLEYEIALCNSQNQVLLVSSLSNSDEIMKMMEAKSLTEAIEACKTKALKDLYSSDTVWEDEDERYKALIASRYLKSVAKGVNSLELANTIMDLPADERNEFVVPTYIKDAIEWVLS